VSTTRLYHFRHFDMTLAVVGDIHGDAERLRSVVDFLKNSVKQVIFVGDYIDRGPSSAEVLEILVEFVCEPGIEVTLLRGNHDQALLQFLTVGEKGSFIAHGGLRTVQSYMEKIPVDSPLEEFRSNFPSNHLKLLQSTRLFFENEDLLVSHCGYNPALPSGRTLDDMVTGRFPELFFRTSERPRELVVFGHYVQETRVPYVADGLICLDTGCGTLAGGPLTVLTLPNREIQQF
jgi:serine/threonine protein phosphatase 1